MTNVSTPWRSGAIEASTPVSLRTRSREHAQSVGGAVYHPHEITWCDRTQDFQMSLQARQLSGITVGLLEYRSAVHLRSEPHPDSYQINLTAFGSITMTQGPTTVNASPQHAAIHDWTHRPTLAGWQQPARVIGLKIPRQLVHDELMALTGREVTEELHFAAGMSLASPAGQEWKYLVQQLARSLTAQTPLLNNSLIAKPLVQSVIRGFLVMAQHNFSSLLHDQPAPAEARYIADALEFMTANSHLPLTIREIATAVNVSVRTLQAGFRKHQDRTPLQALREIRLQRARQDLLTAGPQDTVTNIAARWGFGHPGRFAIHYAQTFAEPPSQTLAHSTARRHTPGA